jgi:DNA ligase 1
MTVIIRPMLAVAIDDLSTIDRDYYVSPKLDGYRCYIQNGVALSKNGKPIRNKYVQRLLGRIEYDGLDGELIVGSPTEGNVIGRTSSGVTSFEDEPDFTFHIFDFAMKGPYSERYSRAHMMVNHFRNKAPLVLVDQTRVHPEGLAKREAEILAMGYEGMMLRGIESPYKFGRSTLKEGWLLKVKRFQDGEGVVLKLEEGEHNENEATTSELGFTKRSSAKGGKRASGLVGTVVVRDLVSGKEMRLAPGKMVATDRARYMNDPRLLVGSIVHWRAFGYGIKDKVRFPQYYGIREDV